MALHGIGETAWPANDALCSALQIINHIQDCGDDYRELDRVYIPQDILTAQGARTDELSGERSSNGLRATLNVMLDKLTPMMRLARELPCYVPDTRLKGETAVIWALAERIVKMLRTNDPLCDNVKLGKGGIFLGTLTGLKEAYLTKRCAQS